VILPIQFPRVGIFGPIFWNHGNKCVKSCFYWSIFNKWQVNGIVDIIWTTRGIINENSHNKPYFIHCRKKKLLPFPDGDSIHWFAWLWRNYPIFGYFKRCCHFWLLFRQVDQINIENNFIIHTNYTLLGNWGKVLNFIVKGKLDPALLVNLINM
jgi:hypothetical protein